MNVNDWIPHIHKDQPENTRGKWVMYRCHHSHILHMPYPANELNWRTTGNKSATIGRISEYRIING